MLQATLISILPWEFFSAHKPGVVPSEVRIPAAGPDDFNILVIGDAITHDYLDSDRGHRPRRIPADEMAESIVFDYWSHLLHVEADSRPGIAWISGELTKEDIKKRYGNIIKELREIQTSWFKKLVAIADDDWTHSRAHRMITDQQRHAAKALNLEKEWNFIPEATGHMIACPACMRQVNSEAAVCENCNAILNEEKARKFKFIGGGEDGYAKDQKQQLAAK